MNLGTKKTARGFTLVELLVVIAIIGVLVALLLPAIQAAREAARRNSCKNNLKQLALGCLNHQSQTSYYPSGGWGHEWIGDADRGMGRSQPGGWIYSVLPFIEQSAVHAIPGDGLPEQVTQLQRDRSLEILAQPLDIINCPSRRSGTFPAGNSAHAAGNGPINAAAMNGIQVGRSDYAGNAGDTSNYDIGGPNSWSQVELGAYNWENTGTTCNGSLNNDGSIKIGPSTGVMCQRSEIGPRHIEDGTSNTYLCGERYINANHYFGEPGANGSLAGGDNETWVTGMNNDVYRVTINLPRQDSLVPFSPNGGSVETTSDGTGIFGSAHAGSFNMAYCDGHIEAVSYDIDLQVHRNNSNRSDGKVDSGNN